MRGPSAGSGTRNSSNTAQNIRAIYPDGFLPHGSAKDGVVVALAQEFGLPVHVVGVGEKAEDLRPFAARDYARGLLGLD